MNPDEAEIIQWAKAIERHMNMNDDLGMADDPNYMFDPQYDKSITMVDLDDDLEFDMPDVDERCDCHLVTGFHEDWIMAVQEQVDNLKSSLFLTQIALVICGIILLVRM